MKVVFFTRKKRKGAHSFERVLDFILKNLPEEVESKVEEALFEKVTPLTVPLNILKAISIKSQDVNHIIGAVYYLTPFLNKKKTVITIHDAGHVINHKKTMKRLILKYFWFDLPVKKATHIIAISNKTKNELVKLTKCDPNKIIVISDPVDDLFIYNKKAFNKACPNILHVGTNIRKGLDKVIKALDGVVCHLSIIGKLSEEQLSLLKKYKINFDNHVNISDEELVERYKESDIVTFVSSYEGFGMPIIEAQAIGRPIVTSDIEPMNDVAGVGACLVDHTNVNLIREAILKLIEDDDYRENVVKLGLENVKKYRADVIANKHFELYKKITDK